MNRVWTYVISKELDASAIAALTSAGEDFVKGWTAHENKLTASFEIFKNRIIIVRVNENVNGASGCSIDKLQRFIKKSEQDFGVELLNRMLVAISKKDGIEVAHVSALKDLIKNGEVSENTVVLNTAVANEDELRNWEKPLKDTWLSKYLSGV